MNSQHIVDSIINRDYNEAEQTMFESLTQKLNDKIIESKYEVANQFREEMEGGSGYDAFFKKAMKKFGISSPADLKTDEKKKEFFDYIDKNFTAKNEGYGGMAKMRRGGSEEEFRFPFGKNPYRPVSTPGDYDPRPVGGRPGPKITRDPIGFPPDFSDPEIPIGPGGLPGGYPGPKIVPDPGFPGVYPGSTPVEAEMDMGMVRRDKEEEEFRFPFGKNPYRPVSTPDDKPHPYGPGGRPGPKITRDPIGFPPKFGVEGEMPEMGAEMMGMDKKKKMGKESGDLESAIKKALDVAGKEQAQAPQAQGGMPGMGGGQMPPMGGGGQNPMAAMAKMMGGGGQMPPMGGGMKPPMGGGQMPPMGGGMKPPMGGMKRRKMGGGM